MNRSSVYRRALNAWVETMKGSAAPEEPSTVVDVDVGDAFPNPLCAPQLPPDKALEHPKKVKGVTKRKRPSNVLKNLRNPAVGKVSLGLLTCLLVSCSSLHRQGEATRSQVRRHEVMEIAEAYRTHRWEATKANVRHGSDKQGIRVDTPDIGFHPPNGEVHHGGWQPGQWNTGVPYQWGGFDTLQMFDQKVKRGFAAGDIYTLVKRAGLEAAVSREAAGIDCSGFISRCWRLKRAYSTRELPSLCDRLNDYDDLRAGDVLNTHNAHVLLFEAWANPAHTVARVYEAGTTPNWKVLRREISRDLLKKKGYEALRYRGIVD